MILHQPVPKDLVEVFAHLLVEHIGIFYQKERWNELEKKMVKIMGHYHFNDPTAFIKWLNEKSLTHERMIQLAKFLTVGETYFFREPKIFNALQSNIFPLLLKKHAKDKQLRIWSAGCCTGEEPYSLAMTLHQMIPDWDAWKIEILATDINNEYLNIAKEGVYRSWSLRSTPQNMIDLYFSKNKNSTFSINPQIKKYVTFEYLNLMDGWFPSPLNHTSNLDLIFCHNVFIYFSLEKIETVTSKFINCLNDWGLLSVSSVELSTIKEKFFTSHNFSGAYFFKKMPVKKEIIPKKENVVKQAMALPEDLYEGCLNLKKNKNYGEASEKLKSFLILKKNDPAFIKKYIKEVLLYTDLCANQGQLNEALSWVDRVLEVEKNNPIPFYVKSVILHFLGDNSAGIRTLKNAIALKPNFIAAVFLLGILEKEELNEDLANEYFKKALDLVQDLPDDLFLMGMESVTVAQLKTHLEHLERHFDRAKAPGAND